MSKSSSSSAPDSTKKEAPKETAATKATTDVVKPDEKMDVVSALTMSTWKNLGRARRELDDRREGEVGGRGEQVHGQQSIARAAATTQVGSAVSQ